MQAYPSNTFSLFASDKIQKAKDITEAKANVAALLSENEVLKKQIQDNLQSHEATVLALHESTEAELKKLKAEVKEKEAFLESAQTQGEVDRKAKESLEAEKQELLSVLSSSIFGELLFCLSEISAMRHLPMYMLLNIFIASILCSSCGPTNRLLLRRTEQ